MMTTLAVFCSELGEWDKTVWQRTVFLLAWIIYFSGEICEVGKEADRVSFKGLLDESATFGSEL
jgi:hypothetical protein